MSINNKNNRHCRFSFYFINASLKTAAIAGVAAIITLAGISAQAEPISFSINASTSNGTPVPSGSTEALQYAANIWGNAIFDYQLPIDHPSALASGYPTAQAYDFDYPVDQAKYFVFPVAAGNHLSGGDLNPGVAEIEIRFNPDRPWYYGLDGITPDDTYDFVTISLHEIAHGLGIVSGMADTGGLMFEIPYGLYEGSGTGYIYDSYVYNNDLSQFPISATSNSQRLSWLDGNLIFTGDSATAANNGSNPTLYSPDEFLQGSSVVHLDPSIFPGDLMDPFAHYAHSNHMPSAIDLGLLKVNGWNFMAQIPEPGSLLLLATGTGMLFLMTYRRKRR
jgi:hypothetical protein